MTRCILDMAMGVTGHTKLWEEAVFTAYLLRNVMLSKYGNMGNMKPLEAFIGEKPELSKISSFGSKTFVHMQRNLLPQRALIFWCINCYKASIQMGSVI